MATTMFTRAASLLTALVALPSMASAEDEWQFRFTPYAWVASLSTDTTIGSGPSTSTDTDLLDVLDFALLLSGEARKGDWGVIAEFNYLNLSDDFTAGGGLFSGESELNGVMGGFSVAYRVLGDESASVDAFTGFRIWSLEAVLDFRFLPTAKRETTFVDPIIGLRGSYDLTDNIFVSGLANIGGFGVGSESQWELLGRVSYRFNESYSAGIGYRHLALEFDRDRADVDAAMSGAFLALDINF